MKIINFKLLFACCILATASCNKSQDLVSKEDVSVDNTAIAQILGTTNQLKQMSMFKLLTPIEKSEIWVQKFTDYLNENRLSDKQKTFVETLRILATPQLFNDISYKESINEPELKATAIKLFGVDGAFILLSTLQKSPSPDPNTANDNCSCSSSSDWCGTYTSCLGALCIATDDGCGTFWSYKCDGRCQTGVHV
jgi:hypothetical protein